MSDKKRPDKFNGGKKEVRNKEALNTKNYMIDIRNAEIIANTAKIKIRAKCSHTDENGRTVLFRAGDKKSNFTGNPLFMCRICGQYLDISDLSEDDLASAIDTVCRAGEIIKMRLVETNENDQKMKKKIANLLFMFRSGKFEDMFRASRRRVTGKRHNNMGTQTFMAGRPMSR